MRAHSSAADPPEANDRRVNVDNVAGARPAPVFARPDGAACPVSQASVVPKIHRCEFNESAACQRHCNGVVKKYGPRILWTNDW